MEHLLYFKAYFNIPLVSCFKALKDLAVLQKDTINIVQ